VKHWKETAEIFGGVARLPETGKLLAAHSAREPTHLRQKAGAIHAT
jgi:hypothetical protein